VTPFPGSPGYVPDYDFFFQLVAGGVAQWLGRRPLAGGLSLIYAWLTFDHFVCKVSAMGQPTSPTQPSIPPGFGK